GKVKRIGVFCDRSEQERLEDELKTRTLQQAALVDLGQQALAGMDLAALMDQAVSVLTRSLDIEFARVLELAPDGRSFNVRAGVGWEEAPGGHATIDLRLRSQAGFTLVSDTPVIVEDFGSESRFPNPPVPPTGSCTTRWARPSPGSRSAWRTSSAPRLPTSGPAWPRRGPGWGSW